ncbi:MAG: hypothetical protein H6767_09405 [Candidatus Peribacteria bacterium]|nr:MAG: hypothetical protein H6767_09405 [Candidatus Peribacteria bacterium]
MQHVVEELGLSDFITLETSDSKDIQTELGIKEMPALIIEEEAIDFKDVIFEGIVPEESEIKSMFISIIGGGEEGCGSGGCSTGEGCGTGCSC